MILIERLTPKKRLLGYNTDDILVARECVECKEFLCISNYSRHAGTNLGYNTRCKPCMKTPYKLEKVNKRVRELRKENPKKYLEKKREYKAKNKERIAQVDKIWQANNKETIHKHSNNWKKKNKPRVYNYIKQREMKIKGCSLKLSKESNNEIKSFYKECQSLNANSNKKYQVDHIIPITSDIICGLHVPWNLQILTKSENSSKKNKFDGTYDNVSWKSKK
jgi:hypothetical protein